MSSFRIGRRPVDLLHEVADLHAFIERELHGVAVAVSDLDEFFFASTESSQSSNVNTRESGQAAAAAARALAGRRLHAILSRGRKRIINALARQRIILWEFSRAGDPTMDTQATTTAPAAAEGEKQRDRKARTASTLQVEPHQHLPNGAAAAAGDDDDWKRHTLVGMHRLLSRKASEQTATAAARATLVRDMTKIAAALERLGIQTTAVAPLLVDDVTPPSSTPPATLSALPADELRCDAPATITSGVATKEVSIDNAVVMASSDVVDGVAATLLRREGEGQGCEGVTSSSSSSSSSSCRERGARQSDEGIHSSDSKSHPLSTSTSSSSRSCSNALLLHQQLQLPDGIDSLLRRISEGIRPPSRNPAPEPQPASPVATAERLRPDNSSSGGLAARVPTPPPVLSENTRFEKRQGSTCGLSTACCSNPRIGVGVACDGSDAARETRCLDQERTRSVAGWDGGCNDGGAGIGVMEERRTVLSPVGLSGACCLPAEGEVVTQRPGEVARVEGEEEAVGGGGGEGGNPNALNLLANRGSFEPGLSCSANCGSFELGLSYSSVVAFASPTKGRPRSSGDLDGGGDKENRRV